MNPSTRNPRVVLIHPPAISKRYLRTKFMPYGMAVVYAYLKEHRVPVVQYDFLMEYLFGENDDVDFHHPQKSFSEDDFFRCLAGTTAHRGLAEFTAKYGSRVIPDAGMYAVSIVAYTDQYWASLLMARYLKGRNPEAVIVFGGPFVTIKPAEMLVRYGCADFWIKGSGEIPLLMLHRILQRGELLDLRDVPGIVFSDGREVFQGAQSRLPAEEERPPDFEGLPLEPYRYDHPVTGEQTLFLPYRLSKGCPSRCSFCTGRLVDRFSLKSVDKVVAELLALSKRHETASFQFADASVNGSPSRLAALCDRLGRQFPDIRWYAYARVSGFSEELLRKAKHAGCFSLFWGIESAHQPTVDLLGKRFSVERMYDLIDAATSLGIKSYVHLMYNAPHETQEDVEAFIRLVNRYVESDLVVFLPQRFLLEPQSLMHEQPARYGLTRLRETPRLLFEREQFQYDEAAGMEGTAIAQRNERHLRMLEDHLELIRYRNLIRGSRNPLIRRFPPRLLVASGKHAARHPFLAALHHSLVNWISGQARGFQEQL